MNEHLTLCLDNVFNGKSQDYIFFFRMQLDEIMILSRICREKSKLPLSHLHKVRNGLTNHYFQS